MGMTKSMSISEKNSPLAKHSAMFGKLAVGAYTAALTASASISMVMASTLGTKIKSAMTSLYTDAKDIFDVCAIVALAISLLFLLFGRSDKSAEPSYKAIKTVIICFIAFHSLGWLVPWLLTIIGHQDYKIGSIASGFIPQIQNLISLL